MDFIGVTTIAATLFGLLTCLVSSIKFSGNAYHKVLLLTFLFSATFYSFIIYLVTSGALLHYPHFLRAGSPFMYLLPISIMLLAQAEIGPKKKPDWASLAWLAIPLLHIVELFPFYIQDATFKAQYLTELPVNRNIIFKTYNGWIPSIWHFYLQALLGVGFFSYTFLITLGPSWKNKVPPERFFLKWINLLALFMSLSFAIIFVLLLMDDNSGKVQGFTALVFSVSLVSSFLFFFLNPEILVMDRKQEHPPSPRLKHVTPTAISENEKKAFNTMIDQYFTKKSGYLSPDFRLQDLASELSLSKHTLSFLINKIYHKNFNQLVNEKRIEVVLEQLDKPEWDKLSLQGIALEVGFRSRTTFNKAFKQKTGCTFSEFRSR